MNKEVAEKFSLLVDLGEITVPPSYVPDKRLGFFRRKYHRQFFCFDKEITDANFSNPTRILKPGDKLHVRVFECPTPNTTSECMKFLATEEVVYTGAQGASLVFEQKRNQLPKGFWYTSFDEKSKLWKNVRGCYGVPYLVALFGGSFDFILICFEKDVLTVKAFFCFSNTV